ncbi:MAG: HAD family phosphatase [Pseudanabaena sp. ELA645]|jgi:HAD superfamily hydrolase (TIGR01509 family)
MKQAIIFDMDGVISDTQQFHAEVESEILKRFEISMSPDEITYQYAGVSDEEMFAEIFEKHNIVVDDIQSVIFDKWEIMKEIAAGRIVAIPHAIDLIRSFNRNSFKLAVASSSTLSFINYVVDSLSIRDMFDALVSAQEVINGKPAPDIFLKAAERLDVAPTFCVVIEDGRSGMIGAGLAGMKSIGLVSNPNDDWPADLLVTSLSEIDIELVHNL